MNSFHELLFALSFGCAMVGACLHWGFGAGLFTFGALLYGVAVLDVLIGERTCWRKL